MRPVLAHDAKKKKHSISKYSCFCVLNITLRSSIFIFNGRMKRQRSSYLYTGFCVVIICRINESWIFLVSFPLLTLSFDIIILSTLCVCGFLVYLFNLFNKNRILAMKFSFRKSHFFGTNYKMFPASSQIKQNKNLSYKNEIWAKVTKYAWLWKTRVRNESQLRSEHQQINKQTNEITAKLSI